MKYPPVNVRVIVETAKFRCLAYVDSQGVWRQHYGDAPLEEVIGWDRPEALPNPKSTLERSPSISSTARSINPAK